MNKKGTWVLGALALLLATGLTTPVFAQAAAASGAESWAPLVAKIVMGLGLSLGLAGSAVGLSIAFQALLGGGADNFFKNIAVAMMPSSQGIYAIVVFFSNMDGFAPILHRCRTGCHHRSGSLFQRLVPGNGMCSRASGASSKAGNTWPRPRSGAMPETYAVFALVMTSIMK
jgi:hypothetical protein